MLKTYDIWHIKSIALESNYRLHSTTPSYKLNHLMNMNARTMEEKRFALTKLTNKWMCT